MSWETTRRLAEGSLARTQSMRLGPLLGMGVAVQRSLEGVEGVGPAVVRVAGGQESIDEARGREVP
jgi:hypothetical protein